MPEGEDDLYQPPVDESIGVLTPSPRIEASVFGNRRYIVSTSKVVVDLTARTFSVEVPDDKLDAVLDRLEEMFSNGRVPGPTIDRAGDETQPEADDAPASAPQAKGGKKRSRSGGAGKVKSWNIVDLGLDEAQRSELRRFFADKAPRGQNEEIAVLAAKLSELSGQKSFNGDQIHSALKIVDRPTPKNMTAVFGNMKKGGLGDYKGLDFIVNHYTEDYVKFKLPHQTKTAK